MNAFTPAGSNARRLVQALCAALALTLLLVLTGCGSTSSTTEGAKSSSGKKTVLTTFTVLADIARNVAGDDLNVESRYCRFALHRDRVFVQVSVPARPFVPQHLRQALESISQVADGIDDDLAHKLGGRTTFPTAG